MKKLHLAIGLLLLISIAATAVVLILSPDVIPAHYNISGQVDRFGSKYENLIYPGFAILTVAAFHVLFRYQQRKNAPEFEQKVLLGVCVFILLLFIALEVFFTIAAIRYSDSQNSFQPDSLVRLVTVGTGIVLVVFGNIMPKARRNALFGLRTGWSMANDRVWQKSQRFGGIAAVICGLLMILLSALVPESWVAVLLTLLILVWIVSSVTASYVFYKAASAKDA